MRVEILLVLTLLGLAYCGSTYQGYHQSQLGVTNYDYADWRDFAWQQVNPNGLCAHLATYETETEFNAIITALTNAQVFDGNTLFFYVGAQKQPNSNLFVWSTGSRRGQPFFSANLVPKTQNGFTNYRFFDINREDGFVCHQEFCFDHYKFFGYNGVYDAEAEAVLFGYSAYYSFPYRSYIVEAEDDTIFANYGIVEYEDAGKIANANGGSKFYVSYTRLPWVEASNEANVAGAYLARIETSEQEQWIRDEMQCVSSTTKERFWMGYQQDALSNKIIKGAGPAQRQVVYDPITGCTTDLYCQFSTGTPAKRSVDYFPGEAPLNAVFFDSADGKWYSDSAYNSRRFLYQAEYCSFNAEHFFRNSFGENARSDSRICVPNPTDDWASADNKFDGNHGYFSEKSFFAGAGVIFQNPENNAKKLLYFDCNCETDPIIDKACLGSEDWPGCALYTNNLEYYLNGQYFQRFIYGLGYDINRYFEYVYWYYLYFLE